MNKGQYRSRAKHDRIVRAIRAEIVSGKLKPGMPLPGQAALSGRFGVSPMTVHLALRQLGQEGCIETRERVGTFVAQRPPHLHSYALVFWNDPVAPHARIFWSKYYDAISQSAARLQRAGVDLRVFHGVDEHADTEDRQRLIQLIESERLAGIVFVNVPNASVGSTILDRPGIPRVAFGSESPYPHVQILRFDQGTWLSKAASHLASQGRRRVALMSFGLDERGEAEVARQLADHGLPIPDYWRQMVNPHDALSARRCAQLLMRGTDGSRPDALLILDDNLVDQALGGVLAAGLRVPEDVAVVAHANFPSAPTHAVPVQFLGYDIAEALKTAIRLIDRQRKGETVPHETSLPAVFEHDWEATERRGVASVPTTEAIHTTRREESVRGG
jgi:DNA-binding LacI/PurR family transcriptional regulator